MKKYQYQILRYVHDQFTGEFVNLGVVVYSPEESFLKTYISQKYGRVTSLFPKANGKFILKILRHFESSINKVAKELEQIFLPSENLSSITRLILPPDDSALMLSEVKYAIDLDLEGALNDLYRDLVEKYLEVPSEHSLSDDDVWKKKYKSYFDKYRITERLSSHEINTKNDSFVFDKSWQNEIWHCYQPISFDLASSDAIRNKIYRWSGILKEIGTTNEKVHISLLTTLSNNYKELNPLIINSLKQDSELIKIDVISDLEAEIMAKKISLQIQEHDYNS
jgi:Protein of unknown function (DUF3037)